MRLITLVKPKFLWLCKPNRDCVDSSAMSSFWISCLSQFEQELPPQQFNTWIRPLRLEGEDDVPTGLRLYAPNGFILEMGQGTLPDPH
jgi:hypothetical protein